MKQPGEKRTSAAKPAMKESDSNQTDTRQTTPQQQAQATQPPKRLVLPKGALVAMRSGGGEPSAREIVVYPDGRATYDTGQKPDMRKPRLLNDVQIARIRKFLEQSDLGYAASEEETQGPTGPATEIAARVHGQIRGVEFPADKIPSALQPLVEQLTGMLPAPKQKAE